LARHCERSTIPIKKEHHYKEQDPVKVAQYLSDTKYISEKDKVYIDQTGMGDDERPRRGYSKKGTLCVGIKPAFAQERMSLMAALKDGKILEPLAYKGTCNAALVEEWLEKRLLPTLPKGSVLILDNAPFHRKKIITKLALNFECTVQWLPPYSPTLNKIEEWWGTLKTLIRKFLGAGDNPKIASAIEYALDKIP
jgi:transposase